MKTVQQCLRDIDIHELADAYMERIPITFKQVIDTNNTDSTILCIKANEKEQIIKVIDYMRTVELKPGKEKAILYAYDCVEKDFKEPAFSLVHINDLKTIGIEAHGYAYEFCEQAEIASFYVADTEYTQAHIIDLLVDVLYESTFFGFGQEELEEQKAKLEEAMKEIENCHFQSVPANEVFNELGICNECDEQEEVLREQFYKAKSAYNEYLRKKQLSLVIDSLQ